MNRIEALLLTGGASRRMGTDKAKIEIGGRPMALRIAGELAPVCTRVTVLGKEALEGYGFLRDAQEGAGPLAALASFSPIEPLVFIASCDLPNFDRTVLLELTAELGDRAAAVPLFAGRPQPLCALYRASALDSLKTLTASGEARMMRWLDQLDALYVTLSDPAKVANVNTPEDVIAAARPAERLRSES